MDFTHYWKRPTEIERKVFRAILQDFQKLLSPLIDQGVELAGRLGVGEPVFHDNGICFNGVRDCGHVTGRWPYGPVDDPGTADEAQRMGLADGEFRMCDGSCREDPLFFPRLQWDPDDPREGLWERCQTNRKPYDLAVTALLLVARRHLGSRLDLDGEERYWAEARILCQTYLGYGKTLSLFEDEDAPQLHRAPWDSHQEVFLREAFRQGMPLAGLARETGRSKAAVEARLVRMGELSPDGYDPRRVSRTIPETVELFRSGLTLEEVAERRGLSRSTVAGHLASAVWMGEQLQLDSLLSFSEQELIAEAVARFAPCSLQRLYWAVEGKVDFARLKIGWAACCPRSERLVA